MVWDTSLNNESEFDKKGGAAASHEEDAVDIEIDPSILDRRVDESKAQK